MTMIIKPIAQETTANSTANSTFANSQLVRIVNLGEVPALISTLLPNNAGVIGSFTMLANSSLMVQKNHTDVLIANNNNVYGVPVAFTNQ